jgi:hypothetical protein
MQNELYHNKTKECQSTVKPSDTETTTSSVLGMYVKGLNKQKFLTKFNFIFYFFLMINHLKSAPLLCCYYSFRPACWHTSDEFGKRFRNVLECKIFFFFFVLLLISFFSSKNFTRDATFRHRGKTTVFK